MSAPPGSPAFALPPTLVARGFGLRPETDADLEFLTQLFASTREQELAPLPWSVEQKSAFLTQQFEAQRRHYRNTIDGAFEVIEYDGAPIGRLYLEPRASHLHLVDITLLPPWRGQGLGAAILEALQDAARAGGRGVSAFVEQTNPARRLYRRLGFVEIANHGVYLEIEWSPEGASRSESGAVAALGGSSGA